jgi:hypothetical protein
MTERQRQADLDINVTPAIEDAFFFLSTTENEDTDDFLIGETAEEYEQRAQACINAGNRLQKLPYEERMQAIHQAHRMIDNIQKYGKAANNWP